MELLYSILLYSSWGAYVYTIFTIVRNKRIIQKKYFWIILSVLCLGISTDLLSSILIQFEVYSSIQEYIYALIIGPLIFLLYKNEISARIVKTLCKALIVGYTLFFLFYFLLNFSKTIDVNIPYIPLIIIVLSLSLTYLFDTFLKMEIPDLTKSFFFWINTGFMIYFGFSLFLHFFSEIVTQDIDIFMYTWPIQLISTILFNITILIGIWRTKQTLY